MDKEYEAFYDYDEADNLKAQYYMLHDQIEGEYMSYSDNRLQSILKFKKGKLHGVCKFFDEEGQLSQLVQFKEGRINGHMITYQDKKRNSYSHYKDDKLDGPLINFYLNNAVKVKIHYKEGKLHGPSYYFNEQGIKISEANYENGKLHGDSIIYYPNGKIYKIEKFNQGKNL